MWIAISGTPGTGKSMIADMLSKRLGWRVVHIGDFVKERELYSGYDKKRKCWIVDVKRLEKEIRKIEDKNLIIEGHFSHLLPVDVVFILRANPVILRKRLKRRGWPRAKIEENVEAEIMEICKIEAIESGKCVFEIDTKNKKPFQIINKIIKICSEV
ncbi:MAG: adenylate kinase family protein [Candidatus Aenigmatarchaeota archaeon]